MTKRSSTCTLIAVLALFLALAATAQADVEPNDYIYNAEGPISGGTKISGTIAAGDLGDDYVFYVNGVQQIHLTGPADNGCTYAELRDTDGHDLPSDFTTPTGVNRYLVAVYYYDNDWSCSSSNGYAYSFQVDPAGAVVTGPGRLGITETAEPNEDIAHAWGALAAGTWYSQRLETCNDSDWFVVYTAPGVHQLDIQATEVTRSSGCYADVQLRDANGESLDYTSPEVEHIGHISYTSSDAQVLYVVRSTTDSDCVGDSSLIQVGPADAISATPPPPPPPPMTTSEGGDTPPPPASYGPTAVCLSARGQVSRWTRSVKRTKRQMRKAHGSKRRALKRKLAAELRTLARARDRVTIRC
jgi:hypothetical protein